MITFVHRVGKLWECALTEHQFRNEADAENHQEQIIKRLQAQGLIGEVYSFGQLDWAYRNRNGC